MQILTRALELRDLIIATLHPIFCRSLSRLIILCALKVRKKILPTALRAVILLCEINFCSLCEREKGSLAKEREAGETKPVRDVISPFP